MESFIRVFTNLFISCFMKYTSQIVVFHVLIYFDVFNI